MKAIRPRLLFWAIGLLVLFLLANLKLRPFPHILLIFWTLLPILSILFSKLSDRRLKASLLIQPQILERGEEGHWICRMKNDSHMMAFFLRFPDLTLLQGKKEKPLEIMLQAKEARRVDLPFMLPFTGPYTMETREPIYEDFLGFIRLSFNEKRLQHMVSCYALPERKDATESPSIHALLSELGDPIQKRSLHSVTDELFSIDPMQRGESMAHVHWKLSARMQDFMVKHYSESAQEPMRILVHPAPVASPAPHFLQTKRTPISKEEADLLAHRNQFLDHICTLAALLLERGQSVDLGDAQSRYRSFLGPEEIDQVRLWLAKLPFQNEEEWKIEPMGDRAQMIFVQSFDGNILGHLMRAYELGVYFTCLSYRSMNTKEMVDRVEAGDFSCLWLDDPKGGRQDG